ncbi:hypothetical protein [Naumannella halotolerans]|uniref:Uncharacterized protein n=1 Tax=Naumannella halotolerans TaxID=993414 RepID=A0A4V3EMU5_9ACTN|nr:hypothetical protein [Naumannella halotolerans]TDT31358.1 hypothetical protein CLV29_2779 [Naumannella halotolerans]
MSYRYSSLTRALADRRSPLREWFDAELAVGLRQVQSEHLRDSGPLLVPAGSANPGTLGAGVDFALRYLVEPDDFPVIAAIAFSTAARMVIREVGLVATDAALSGDRPLLARACWALALCTEVYRAGPRPDSALTRLGMSGFSVDALLSLAPADGVRQSVEMLELASAALLPKVDHDQVVLGPEFEGSQFCAADADLICGDLLLDIKTRLGDVDRRTGDRRDKLPASDLHQLIGYALFDRSDHFGIRRVGIYSARYARLSTWDLEDLLTRLAGHPVDLTEARRHMWSLLGGW